VIEAIMEHCDECSTLLQDPKISPINTIILALFQIWSRTPSLIGRPTGYGVCVPSQCSYRDVGTNLNSFVGSPIFNTFDISSYGNKNEDFFCIAKDHAASWDGLNTFIAIVFGAIGIFIVLGTLADVFSMFGNEKESPTYGKQLLLSFSLYTNLKELMNTQVKSKDTLTCLDGMRFISMTWVVLGHNFIFSTNSLIFNNFKILADIFSGKWGVEFEAIANALPSVDSFFLFSGLLVGYLTFKELDRCKGKFNLIMYYVHRYIRLSIPLALIIAFVIAFLPTLARTTDSQLTHDIADGQASRCREYGWSILLYVNNFIEHGSDCIGVIWYTCDDMIFFWLSFFVVYPMWNNTRSGALAWWLIWLVASTIPLVYQTWKYDLGLILQPDQESDPEFALGYGTNGTSVYEAPWNRFQPYLVGILLGYILHLTRGQKIHINPKLNVLCWQAAFLTAFGVVYGTYSHYERGRLTQLENVLYNGFQRIGWSLSLSWVIFSCSKGHGGMINDFLSWRFFLPLSRLSFMTFLIHSLVIFIAFKTFSTIAVDLSWPLLVCFFFGNLMISISLAMVAMLVVETPFVKLEKLILGRLLAPKQVENGRKPV